MAAAAAAVAAEDPRLQGEPMATSPQDCGDKRKQDVLGGSLYALQEPLRGQRDAGHGEHPTAILSAIDARKGP